MNDEKKPDVEIHLRIVRTPPPWPTRILDGFVGLISKLYKIGKWL